MPQMAPYNWFMLFMMFNSMSIIFFSINYYLNMPQFKFLSKKKLEKNYNFMW